jgi:hypothetical protein
VHHSDLHFLHNVVVRLADAQDRVHVDADPVRQHSGVPVTAFGQRDPFVKAQKFGLPLGGLVLDEDRDVVHQPGECGRDPVKGFGDEFFELLTRHLQHTAIVRRAATWGLTTLVFRPRTPYSSGRPRRR